MRPQCLVLLLLWLAGTACSPRGWVARWHTVQAENARTQANRLKEKKESFEKRRPYYIKSCRLYASAYEVDPSVFNLARIGEAIDSCGKAGLKEQETFFWYFEEQYSKAHPQEERYGDAGVGMIEMG